MTPNASLPLIFTAVVKSRIQSYVFDQLGRGAKALDISDQSSQSEGYQITHSTQPHHRKQLGIGEDFLRYQTAPMPALLIGMSPLHQTALNDSPFPRRPGTGLLYLFSGLG